MAGLIPGPKLQLKNQIITVNRALKLQRMRVSIVAFTLAVFKLEINQRQTQIAHYSRQSKSPVCAVSLGE
jgi:hypothetical protein